MERTAMIVTAVVSMGVAGVSGFWVIPWLRRLKYKQTINLIGPKWHAEKEGTPTIGGLMFILGSLIGISVGYITLILEVPQFLSEQYITENVRLLTGIGAAAGFGLIGFLDDYLKVVHTRNLGLTAKWKMFLQVLVAALYLFLLEQYGTGGTTVAIPFMGSFDFGVWYYILSMIFIVGFVNAVNLTDGLDGLASSVTITVTLGFVIVSAMFGYVGTNLLSTGIAGSLVGFLIWNFHPAKVFMGDTGSMYLGGAVVAMGYGVSFPLLLILAGLVYLCEAASVILQVSYFKATKGKRIFKMTPIHHHFELCGMGEARIVVLFSFVALIGTVLAVFAAASV